MTSNGDTPLLWHLKVSHYNEKARWALDYKGIPHARKAIDAGLHQGIAKKKTGGRTFPILEVDSRAVGDSTEIIAALERRNPEPPLYPADEDERAHALELEEFFDEELGPYARRVVLWHTIQDKDLFLSMFLPDLPGGRRRVALLAFPLLRRRILRDFEVNERTVAEAFDKIRAAGERIRAEAGDGDYLVGDRFTVADLTAAAIASPVACPEQFPYPQPHRGHELMAPVADVLEESGVGEFTREMYSRHRGTSAEVGAPA